MQKGVSCDVQPEFEVIAKLDEPSEVQTDFISLLVDQVSSAD